jgi:ribosomal protein S6
MPDIKGEIKLAKYEAVFILDPRKVEENGEEFSDSIQEQIKSLGGVIHRVKFLEKRVFSRPIRKHKTGVYWDYVFDLDPAQVEVLQERYSLNLTVLRMAVFNFVDGQDDDVFKSQEERRLSDDNFQDDIFDRDPRSYRSRS